MSRPGSGSKPSGDSLKVRVKTSKSKTVSQKIWLERQLNDPYVHEAKKLGYRSRSAFKLIEIDDKYELLKPGFRVVDLGAAPGGWCQVASKRVKSEEGKGRVVAIDMHSMEPMPGVIIFKKDFYDEDAPAVLIEALGGEQADCVFSDMATHATGHKQTG
jgi:23S rRNA (uridine2552-2'-O)-methyltransferase